MRLLYLLPPLRSPGLRLELLQGQRLFILMLHFTHCPQDGVAVLQQSRADQPESR